MININLGRMVDEIDSKFALESSVKSALLAIPRDIFVPSSMQHLAYELDALPIQAKQFISSPLTVAKMTQYLALNKSDSVLEIGLGSGYQAAVLSNIARSVFSIERIAKLRNEAIIRIKKLKIMNVNTKLDDGNFGWERFAPFDRILFSAALSEIPQAIINQLNIGGILVAPIINPDGTQYITRFSKTNMGLKILDVRDKCLFVSVLNSVEY